MQGVRAMRGSMSTHLARTVGRWVRARPAHVVWPGGVVSFTFDDFPRSALVAGGAILEQYGLRGTYYAALGLTGSDSAMGRLHDREDLRAVVTGGHELACHTYSHLDCSRTALRIVLGEIAENASAMSALTGEAAPASFAYPFGGLSLAAKRALAARFASCRGVSPGINTGAVDLADLRSRRLYDGEFDASALRHLIEANRELGGWLIFYTHDVAAAPSRWGCTPAQFETAVACAAQCCEVLPVRAVVPRLAAAPRR